MELPVKAEQFGIEEKKASELLVGLPQIKEERAAYEQQYSVIITEDIESIETARKARELRLKIAKNRTQGITQWHKNAKDYFLKGGQFVDAVKRMEIAVNEKMEADLEQIEKYQEIKEKKRLDELEAKRKTIAEPYSEFLPFGVDIRNISDEDFEKLLTGAKLQHEAKIKAERKAEEERQEQLRLDKLENERKLEIAPYLQFLDNSPELRLMSNEDYSALLESCKKAKVDYEKEQEKIRLENERLRKEAEEKAELRQQREVKLQPYMRFVTKFNELLEMSNDDFKKSFEALEKHAKQVIAKEEKEKRLAQEKADKEAKEKADLQAKIDQKNKEESERLAKEQADKKAKEKAELEAKKEAERLAKAPVKEQMNVWVNSFILPETSLQNDSVTEIKEKFEAFKKWSLTQIEKF